MDATYVCAACGGEFKHGRSDEDAHQEALRDFGRDGHADDMEIVCDDCYRAMRQRAGDRWGEED
jgi:DNA-directed RNA polymerase subunit RPC12/RpoP